MKTVRPRTDSDHGPDGPSTGGAALPTPAAEVIYLRPAAPLIAVKASDRAAA